MTQLVKVRPTKIELIKLKRRLSLAEKVQKIVKDRLSILTMEFLQIARDTIEAKIKLLDSFAGAYRAIALTAGYHGYLALEKELTATMGGIKVATCSRNAAGIKLPLFEQGDSDNAKIRGYSLLDTSSWLDHAVELSQNCLQAIIELAELQRSLDILGMEINRAKRVTNALEYVEIPGLKTTIKFLYMKFEEREREEKTRLKRVKVLLERR